MATRKKPKAGATKRRRDPSPLVRDEVLREAGYKCGNPACRHVITLEVHHIVWVRDDGKTEPTNLLALCPNCHSLHTAKHIPQAAIRHWKGLLHALNHAFNKESMDLLLFLRVRGDKPHMYTADGVLRFAGLFAAGLVEFGDQICEETFSNFIESRHAVVLSEKGRLLVEAWVKGDEQAYRAALGRPSDGLTKNR